MENGLISVIMRVAVCLSPGQILKCSPCHLGNVLKACASIGKNILEPSDSTSCVEVQAVLLKSA